MNDLYKLTELTELEQTIFKNEKNNCDKCKSFKNCPLDIKGLMPIVIYDKIYNSYRIGHKKCLKAWGSSNTSLIKESKYEIFEAINKKEIIDQLEKNNHLYLMGLPGLGKTHFLYYIANIYNEKGKDVYVNLTQNMMREIKERLSQYQEKEGNTRSIVNTLQQVDVLCIDDLGNERASSFTLLEVLQAVIDYRYLHNKMTIISSNHHPDKLFNFYKNVKDVEPSQIAPIISRLKDFGIIEIKNKYWRNI